MKGLLNDTSRKKTLFKSYYCLDCKQRKPCGKIIFLWKSKVSLEYCCSCQFQIEQEKAQEYNNYQQVYQRNLREREAKKKQYQLLKSYQGCKQWESLAVDAYSLYENNQLACQPCRMKKEGSASGAISFLEQSKWYKRYWKIDLTKWLENFSQLPVNAECARKWLKDKEHLKNCQCLELETQQHYSLINDNLKRSWERLKECKCLKSEKVRVSDDNYAWCERCETSIPAASKKRVIKNRNDPSFWGLEIKERILCGDCLEKTKEKMPSLWKAEFNRYRKVKRL